MEKMANYYYSEQPDVEHNKQYWSFELRGQTLQFASDNGVFSKRTVDYGTRVLLATFTTQGLPAGPLLDLGCGYGPIGLSLAKEMPQRQVDMVDVNELAMSLARENAQRNQIENATVFSSNVYEKVTAQYAAILTNPPVRAGKAVVTAMLTEAKAHLVPGGELWVVLQKKQGAPSAKKNMQATFGNAELVHKDKGYYILRSRLN
jgi:16S rRNA (guanine1207-N2)-methyltransferase